MSDALATLAALRESGADRVDPVRFHFLEALAQRAQLQPEAVAQSLEQKLTGLLKEYQSRCQQAEKAAKAAAKKNAKKPAAKASSSLSDLLAHIAASSLASDTEVASETPSEAASIPGATAEAKPTAPTELKALRYFRDDWSKLSTDQVISQSLASAPENAGPLNSHMLVLKAIEVMRDAAPAYLSNFISYADTLLWLEQAVASLPAKKPAAAPEGEKKRKPRSRAR